jgi:hypothetical protein
MYIFLVNVISSHRHILKFVFDKYGVTVILGDTVFV